MSFKFQQFQEQLGNVDKDYRLMALFDLMKSLKSGDASATHDAVVAAVIKTLSDTDGQVRNDAVSVFPLLVVSCKCEQQNTIFTHLIKNAAAQASGFGTKAFSEQADLCAMALKRSTAALAEACQRSVETWQTEITVVTQLLTEAVAQLQKPIMESGRENVYTAIVGLISLFANTWKDPLKRSFAMAAMKDFHDFPNSCRLTGTCIARVLPFTDSGTFAQIKDFTLSGVEKGTETTLPAFLQLCAEAFVSDSYRLRSSAPHLVDVLLQRLKTTVNGAEDPKADSELLILDTLLNTYKKHLSPKWQAIFDVCEKLGALGGAVGASVGDADAYATDDYYAEDYYGSSTDETWKLRREALRVTASLATLSDVETLGAKALAVAGQGLCDSSEDVQLEAFPVIQTVAKKPYATSPQIVNSLVELCPTLLYFLQFQGKTFLPALGCIEGLFRPDNDALSFAPHVAKGLEEALSNTPKSVHCRAELVRVTCWVVESILASANPSVHKYAKPLCLKLLDTTTTECHPKAVLQCVGAVENFIAAHHLFPDAQIGEKALAMLDTICTAPGFELTVRCSAVSAAARWGGACENQPQLVTALLLVLEHGVEADDTAAAALKAISDSVSSAACAKQIQSSSVVARVIATLHTSNALSLPVACDCVTALLRAGILLSQEQKAKVLEEAKNSVSECISPVLYMCSALCEQSHDSASDIYEHVASRAWAKVPLSHQDEYTFMPSPPVVALATVCASIAKASAPLRKTISERVLQALTQCTGDASTCCALVRGVAVADDAFTTSFVSTMRQALSDKRACWLLALGEAARVMKLPSDLETELLDSVCDASGERVRASGKNALSVAMTNVANGGLATACAKRAVAPDAKGSVYLLKAIQVGARRAAGMTASPFHDANLCVPLIEALLLSKSDDSVTDAAGGCIGSVACFFPAVAAKLLCSAAEKNPPSTSAEVNSTVRVLCACAARFILTSTDNQAAQLSLKPLVELLFPDFTRDHDLALRQSLARLFTAVAHTYPAWLRCDEFKSTFRHLVVDLIPCSKLVGRLLIGNYTHCTDRGLELRVQTFDCMSAIFDADERKGAGVLTFVDASTCLLDALIQECGTNGSSESANTAETDKGINERAKRLVARFFRLFPETEPTETQINQLCNNLDVNLDVVADSKPASEMRDASTVQSISLICNLEKNPCFANNAAFQKLGAKTLKSPFLADAVAMK